MLGRGRRRGSRSVRVPGRVEVVASDEEGVRERVWVGRRGKREMRMRNRFAN